VLAVLVYDQLGRFLGRLPFLRICLASSLVLLMEAAVYVVGGFWGLPGFASLLVSTMAGKIIVAVIYSLVLSLYLRFTGKEDGMAFSQVATEASLPTLTYREKYERLQQESMRDALTGLFNRGTFDALIRAQLVKCARTGKSLSLLMVDVDRFKNVNDMFGHQEGDEVLRTVARAIQQVLRINDFACRFGGEEFAVLLPDADAQAAVAIADRMRKSVTDECRLRTLAGTVQPLTISVGIATAPLEGNTVEVLVEMADRRLYEAKRAGRDRVSSTGMFAPLPPTLAGA